VPGRDRGAAAHPAGGAAALGVDPTPPPRSLATTDPRGYLARLQEANGAAELLDRRGLGAHGWLVRPVGVDDPLAAAS
jgi:hypothetical protein